MRYTSWNRSWTPIGGHGTSSLTGCTATMGMPEEVGNYYELGKSPTQGLPNWCCDAFGLEELQKPFPLGWAPSIFNHDELENLAER